MKKTNLNSYAAQALVDVYNLNDFEMIYKHLCGQSAAFSSVSAEAFSFEYLASRLAMASLSWIAACKENNITDDAEQKIFLKLIMNSFASPKFVNIASVFSEYLYSRDEDNKTPSIAVAHLLFKRLGKESMERTGGVAKMNNGFQVLVEIFEGFRSSFENDFFEFINAAATS